MLMRGTTKRTREQLRDEFDRLKANVGVSGEGASIETMRANLPGALRLVAEILREPSFPEKRIRAAEAPVIAHQHRDPEARPAVRSRASRSARHLNPYPPEHWLYTPTLDERTARLRRPRSTSPRCHAEFVGASHSELAVVGDFDPDEVTRAGGELFGDWKSPRPYARIPQQLLPGAGGSTAPSTHPTRPTRSSAPD